jgi:hypothetical protein
MFGSGESASCFWARFIALCSAGPDLLCVVCKHLSDSDLGGTTARLSFPAQGNERHHDARLVGCWVHKGYFTPPVTPPTRLQRSFPTYQHMCGGDMLSVQHSRTYLQLLESSTLAQTRCWQDFNASALTCRWRWPSVYDRPAQ